MNKQEWLILGQTLFGQDMMQWKFKCPCCGHIATAEDYKKANAPSSAVAFSCVGRWMPVHKEAFDDKDKRNIPCNYSGGGLLNINPVIVDDRKVFEFGV
ncbi:MAG: VVA0879 family protein [Nostoc sp. DedQUE04]|uniref:VVA0879 family protein n=1 Tax=Nostoc sp. DedQUE04 TaxID=3075390 RepID=UPI002AD419AD|nr:VVA0879 family protein [Nostoc sp. DedQUE04]MDZ8140782.1 VVA0879 family protein [Nostoc sp. DedQUE04]